MLIRDYALPDSLRHLVSVSEDLIALLDPPGSAPGADPPRLLVWRRAMTSGALEVQFAHASWPLAALEAMPPGDEWPWSLAVGEAPKLTHPAEIGRAVAAAAGTDAPPVGNVHVTLELRTYDERASEIGGHDWWRRRLLKVAAANAFGQALAAALLTLHTRAAAAGSELFVEQLSIILAKDPTRAIATLTPTLHSDTYYGVRETAIASLLERGYDGLGGAMYLPARNMGELWSLRPILLDKLERELGDEVVVQTASGDVLIYDGMIGADGVRRNENGIPHISPERPGNSSRLAILMHHRRRPSMSRPGPLG